jgi:hypothetical protein
MPPLGYGKYETLSEPTEVRQLESVIVSRMGQIMQRNINTAPEKFLLTPQVHYDAADLEGDLSVRAWLFQTYPTRSTGEAEIVLATQKIQQADDGEVTQSAVPDKRVRLNSKRPNELDYVGLDKENLTEDARLRLARDIIETLDLIEAAVEQVAHDPLSQS